MKKGVTLLEMMIALMIGSVLLGVVFQLLNASFKVTRDVLVTQWTLKRELQQVLDLDRAVVYEQNPIFKVPSASIGEEDGMLYIDSKLGMKAWIINVPKN